MKILKKQNSILIPEEDISNDSSFDSSELDDSVEKDSTRERRKEPLNINVKQ